jgi:NAD(P)H-dependent flavin oxidoreductase YrpB (nitropropane dioxygenase family)
MKSPICDMLGIEFPLLAFSHCRDVVAAVSRAGGFGVLGATSHTPESIEQELKWIDDHVDGKPYGLDVLIPENISTAGEKDITWKSLEARVPSEHRAFTPQPPEEIRYRADDDQRRRQPAAAVRRAMRAGSARGLVQASDPVDCECAGRAAENDDRHGQKARCAGRGIGRR